MVTNHQKVAPFQTLLQTSEGSVFAEIIIIIGHELLWMHLFPQMHGIAIEFKMRCDEEEREGKLE